MGDEWLIEPVSSNAYCSVSDEIHWHLCVVPFPLPLLQQILLHPPLLCHFQDPTHRALLPGMLSPPHCQAPSRPLAFTNGALNSRAHCDLCPHQDAVTIASIFGNTAYIAMSSVGTMILLSATVLPEPKHIGSYADKIILLVVEFISFEEVV